GSIRLAGLPGAPADGAEAADRGRGGADCQGLSAALRHHGIAGQGDARPLGRGIFLPDDAAPNPARRVIAQAGELVGRARLHEHTRVVSITLGRVVTDHGVIAAPVVVVAVDGRLDALLPALA